MSELEMSMYTALVTEKLAEIAVHPKRIGPPIESDRAIRIADKSGVRLPASVLRGLEICDGAVFADYSRLYSLEDSGALLRMDADGNVPSIIGETNAWTKTFQSRRETRFTRDSERPLVSPAGKFLVVGDLVTPDFFCIDFNVRNSDGDYPVFYVDHSTLESDIVASGYLPFMWFMIDEAERRFAIEDAVEDPTFETTPWPFGDRHWMIATDPRLKQWEHRLPT